MNAMDNIEKRELANYRATDTAGLLVRLPVPLGSEVWQICNNPAWNNGVESAEKFLFGETRTPRHVVRATRFTVNMVDDWEIRVFPTETEAQRAL